MKINQCCKTCEWSWPIEQKDYFNKKTKLMEIKDSKFKFCNGHGEYNTEEMQLIDDFKKKKGMLGNWGRLFWNFKR